MMLVGARSLVAGRGAFLLLVTLSAVLCLTVHESQDSTVLDAESISMAVSVGDGDEAETAALVKNGPKGQPLISRGNKAKCATASDAGIKLGKCTGSSNFIYNRLQGGTLTTADGTKCITRKTGGSKLTLAGCKTNSTEQTWQRLCGAWANGNGVSGRVLDIVGDDVVGAQWSGKETQLWDFKEVVHHAKCAKKKYKLMKFGGTVATAVHLSTFLSFPSKLITMAVWLKGSKGTAVSYATKNHIKAFVLQNVKSLDVYIKDLKIPTKLDVSGNGKEWVHVAVSWNSATGNLVVYKNGVKAFSKSKVQAGKAITQGGCLVLGQEQQKVCAGLTDSYEGLMTDFQIWREEAGLYDVHRMSVAPIDMEIYRKLGKPDQPRTPQNLRVAYLVRQFSEEETKEPLPAVCEMDAFKKKDTPKLKSVPGNMPRFYGTGDVHYSTFTNCKYDDQSVGEWTAVQTKPKYWLAAPLIIQFRTNPRKSHCPWCQNGGLAYIDGCAVKYKDEQASAGFGGFGYGGSYTPYAAMNGQKLNGYRRGTDLEVWAHSNYFKAIVISEGVLIECRSGSMYITMPNKFKGKIYGLAGTGEGGHKDWDQGPNVDAYPKAKLGVSMPGLTGHCHHNAQYPYASSAFNGNHVSKPVVKFMKSWMVDGNHIPSVFYYSQGHGAGSFNRVAGEGIKPPSGGNKKPSGAKEAATKECRALRNTPKALEKCVFDFMMQGPDAVKASQRDRMAQREAKPRKPTHRTIRDITQFVNHAEWTKDISWVCASDFRQMQAAKRAQYNKARDRRAAIAKEKAEKAELARQRSHASKNGPCPSGFKTTWHPGVFKDKVPSSQKQCSIGMVAVSTKSKAAHVGSNKLALSILTEVWVNGKNAGLELGESASNSTNSTNTERNDGKPQSKVEQQQSSGFKTNDPEDPDPTFLSAGADIVISGSNQPDELELGEDGFAAQGSPTPLSTSVSLLQEGQGPVIKGWGNGANGGSVTSVEKTIKDVLAIAATTKSFAAITKGGAVSTWGHASFGGDSSKVRKDLVEIDSIYSTCCAFAARSKKGGVVTWGQSGQGGDSRKVADKLKKGVRTVTGTYKAFAAITDQGKLVTWGDSKYGGDSNTVVKAIEDSTGLKSISSTHYAFAAMTKSRRRSQVLTWGIPSYGGKYSTDVGKKMKDVKQVFGNKYAFAALLEKGDVVTWGHSGNGGNSDGVKHLLKDVVSISSTESAFAALTAGGRVITWGQSGNGGNSHHVRGYLTQGITAVFGTAAAFAALTKDGTVYNWGSTNHGGKRTHVTKVVSVAASSNAFALVKTDGSVVSITRPPPPPAPGHCHYVHRGHTQCTDTGMVGCGNPMLDLSKVHGHRRPYQWSPLYHVYIYMDRWNGGCGAWHGSWCRSGNSESNQYALCANGPGQSGTGGTYISTLHGWRYYRVRVAGRMTTSNIHKTCKARGYATPCPGRGGNGYAPPAAKTANVKGVKVSFANTDAFVGLNAPVSSLCQTRYAYGERFDARCGDGWQEEGKSMGAPVCDDDNQNPLIPCSMLKKSCHMAGVQAMCASTCNTYHKGSEECKAIGLKRDGFKCVPSFSCTALPKSFAPPGLKYLKPRPRENQGGCGTQARLEMGACSSNPKQVSCACSSAYKLQGRSLSRSDCEAKSYQTEAKMILGRIGQLEDHTSQWLSTCSSVPESAGIYKSKPIMLKGLKMKNGETTVWETKILHSLSVPQSADECMASFTMAVSICNTAPFKRMILRVPFTGEQYQTVGCGCQEILARAGYTGQITIMPNKMQATQSLCAKHFAQWNFDFQQEYFFGGMEYQGHAIRLAKEIRKQCKNPGQEVLPEVKYKRQAEDIAHVMKVNAKSIRENEASVQEASVRVLRLQKEKAQCLASLPQKRDNYKELVGEFSIEANKQAADLLKDEAIEMKTSLKTREENKAKLKLAQNKVDKY